MPFAFEISDHVFWIVWCSKLLFQSTVSHPFEIIFLQSEMFRSFSRKVLISKSGLCKNLTSLYAIQTHVFIATVSKNLDSSLTKTACESELSVTVHDYCIDELSEANNLLSKYDILSLTVTDQGCCRFEETVQIVLKVDG